jgi:hypothetical protein
MSEIENLVKAYERFTRLPWDTNLAGAQKVWFAVYEPAQERRLRLRLDEFATATKNAGHTWKYLDLTDAFAHWMAQHRYREAYFESPEDMELALPDFAQEIETQITATLTASEVDENTVVAIGGLASLFGLASASSILNTVVSHIRGRLLVFFPGQYEGSNYRLLDARDGWNYLAIPITASDGD